MKMKKYLIQNSNRSKFVCDDNLLTHNIDSAKLFVSKKEAQEYLEANKLIFHLGTKLFVVKRYI